MRLSSITPLLLSAGSGAATPPAEAPVPEAPSSEAPAEPESAPTAAPRCEERPGGATFGTTYRFSAPGHEESVERSIVLTVDP